MVFRVRQQNASVLARSARSVAKMKSPTTTAGLSKKFSVEPIVSGRAFGHRVDHLVLAAGSAALAFGRASDHRVGHLVPAVGSADRAVAHPDVVVANALALVPGQI
jgi:hypothetical protein